MADSDPRIPGNMKLNVRDSIDGGSSSINYYGTFPQHRLAIAVDKNGETAKVEVTTDAKLSTGTTKLNDSQLSNSSIIWNEVSASNTTDYFSGDSFLITGVKITAPVSSNVQVSLTQTNQ